jgi:hypothetical protein
MASTHTHPNPLTDRLAQVGGVLLMGVMVAGALGQFALAFASAGLPLFWLSGIVTLLLIAPVMLLTSATPAVTVSPEGITIQPRVWRERFVRWQDIHEIREYPLLPPKGTEAERRLAVGRRRYRPAEGKMLLIPSLPLQYRFTGFFVGVGFSGVIAVTNRTHTEYEALIRQLTKYVSAGETSFED